MPRAVRETFPFGLCGSDELVWYGEGESMTSMSPVGQEEPYGNVANSSHTTPKQRLNEQGNRRAA